MRHFCLFHTTHSCLCSLRAPFPSFVDNNWVNFFFSSFISICHKYKIDCSVSWQNWRNRCDRKKKKAKFDEEMKKVMRILKISTKILLGPCVCLTSARAHTHTHDYNCIHKHEFFAHFHPMEWMYNMRWKFLDQIRKLLLNWKTYLISNTISKNETNVHMSYTNF